MRRRFARKRLVGILRVGRLALGAPRVTVGDGSRRRLAAALATRAGARAAFLRLGRGSLAPARRDRRGIESVGNAERDLLLEQLLDLGEVLLLLRCDERDGLPARARAT